MPGTNAVAPFVGAWIEITICNPDPENAFVAPFVGAWIEMDYAWSKIKGADGRSLRGSVD